MSGMSDVICPLILNHVYTGTRNERRLCCSATPRVSQDKKRTDEEWWNSEEMKGIRRKMMRGEKLEMCGVCYYREENGLESLRQEGLHDWDIDELLKNLQPDGSVDVLPEFFEHKSVHCNLKCQTCTPVLSSTWMKLEKEMYGYKWPNNFDDEYEEKQAESIINAILDKRCKKINWAGGEPMMMPVHWKVTDKLVELLDDPEYHDYVRSIRIQYNTNLTKGIWKNKSIPEMLKPFNIELRTSMDGVGDAFEFNRDGAKWDECWNVWNEYYDLGFEIEVNAVYTAPLIMNMDAYQKQYIDKDVRFYDHIYVTYPDQYPGGGQGMVDIRLYPQHIFDRIVTNAENSLKKYMNEGFERGLDILRIYRDEKQKMAHIFENEDIIRKMKGYTEHRDNFCDNVKFQDLIWELDQEAAEWYSKIESLPYDPNENKQAGWRAEDWEGR
ncbi:MAG: twitch domain-containing radical SAM protein [Alteromonadaceae bacterium TMED7]|nr:MAG: twitch domain-containing radical SAM protein [Alteromonadaceae bacterium TMED7]